MPAKSIVALSVARKHLLAIPEAEHSAAVETTAEAVMMAAEGPASAFAGLHEPTQLRANANPGTHWQFFVARNETPLKPFVGKWRGVQRRTPEQRITTTVRDAQVVLSAYVEPGFRDPERTINELFNVLDDYQLIEALEKIENEQPGEERSAGSQSHKPEGGLRGEVLDKAPWG